MTTPKLNLIDTNNHARIKFETDPFALRALFERAFRDPEPMIYVFDGRDAKASRRAIFPGYKVGRTAAPDNFYRQLDIFRELLLHTNKVQVRVDGREADDVIATLVRSHPTQKFLIESNDGDFMRLVNENVAVSCPTIKDVPPHEIRLYKTLQGDGSDKIPGVRLFGKKSWEALTVQGKLDWYGVMETLEGLDHLDDATKFTMPEGDFNLSKNQVIWCNENWRLIKAFWTVVDFQDVPAEDIAKGTRVGKPNYQRADELLREMLI